MQTARQVGNRRRPGGWSALLTAALLTAGCATTPQPGATLAKESQRQVRDARTAEWSGHWDRISRMNDAETRQLATLPDGPAAHEVAKPMPAAPVRRVQDATVLADQLRVQAVGNKLVTALKRDNEHHPFGFTVIAGKQPRIFHTAGGHICLTTALTQELTAESELAATLSLEMVETLHELRQDAIDDQRRDFEAAAGVARSEDADDTDDHRAVPSSFLRRTEPLALAEVRSRTDDLLRRSGLSCDDERLTVLAARFATPAGAGAGLAAADEALAEASDDKPTPRVGPIRAN